jgi:hypothetical protein
MHSASGYRWDEGDDIAIHRLVSPIAEGTIAGHPKLILGVLEAVLFLQCRI